MNVELTRRQEQVLRALLAGKRTEQLARELNINVQSVQSHLGRIRYKVGVRTLIQLGAWCERHGIREGAQP